MRKAEAANSICRLSFLVPSDSMQSASLRKTSKMTDPDASRTSRAPSIRAQHANTLLEYQDLVFRKTKKKNNEEGTRLNG